MTTKFFKYAGIVAGVMLIAIGIGAIAMGVNGRTPSTTTSGWKRSRGRPI